VRKALVISLLALAVLVGSGAAALHRYDASHEGEIAEGTTIGGIDVGGLSEQEARAKVRQELSARLEQPVILVHRGQEFELDAAYLRVRTDADALVDAAVAESREGNFLERSFRDLTGRAEGSDYEIDVDYSDEAVARLVRGIQRELDQSARDASVSASFAGVHLTPARPGVTVRAQALRREIVDSLVSAESRRMAVPTTVVRPKVTTKELSDRFSHFIAISRGRRELRLFVNRKLAKTYSVGIGALGFETPTGLYEIESKAANPAWYVPDKAWAGDLAGKVIKGNDPDNPIKARWMGFWDGAGIHGTADVASIGTAASHGCIRMRVRDVIDLYDRVPLHTPLSIA
jgi:lipoprotein-anchoring transpeptidase ErfK/SrfK